MSAIYRIMGNRGRVTIPYVTRLRIGFSKDDVISFVEGKDGKSVIIRREEICDHCGLDDKSKETDSITLKDFLNDLTDEQQMAAFTYLNMKWGNYRA